MTVPTPAPGHPQQPDGAPAPKAPQAGYPLPPLPEDVPGKPASQFNAKQKTVLGCGGMVAAFLIVLVIAAAVAPSEAKQVKAAEAKPAPTVTSPPAASSSSASPSSSPAAAAPAASPTSSVDVEAARSAAGIPPSPAPAERTAYLAELNAIDPEIVNGKDDKAVSRGLNQCMIMKDEKDPAKRIESANRRFLSPNHPDGFGAGKSALIVAAVQKNLCPTY
ncbi:hypothetical protein [Streptomyces virginiae]